MLKLVYSQLFKNKLKKWVRDKQNQRLFGSLYSVENIDIFHIKTISFPSLVSFMYSSKIGTKIVWSYFRLNIACNDKRVRH